jgi:hypothetical protein
MAESSLQREMTSRSMQERPQQWKPAELLPEPDKAPGYAYRWIRISFNGRRDPKNFSAKMREGWEPVTIEEQPKFQLLADPDSRFKNNIEIDGLLLCKTPVEFVAQRNAYFQSQNRAQAEAVDNNLMRQSDSRMPIFKEGKSSTSFGKGT